MLFDGVCNLCNGAVRFIAANDPERHFAFASLQSPSAQELLGEHASTLRQAQDRLSSGQAAADAREPDSVILVSGGRRYERSDAALHIALGLRAPWPLAFGAILVPRGVRDAIYRWIARNRYRWFGRTEVCALPPPGLRERFLPGALDDDAP